MPTNGRVENAVQRVQGLIRMLKNALERRINKRTKSSDPIFAWMVEWSAGLIVRYESKKSRIEYREVRVWTQYYVCDVKE